MSVRWHLEGMGLRGALVARLAQHLKIPFTWSDTDTRFNAWQASTGAVRPDDPGWGWWSERYPGDLRVPWWKHPGGLQSEPVFVFNVAQAVIAARETFKDCRLEQPRATDPVLVTHGFTAARWLVWGWSAPMGLKLTSPLPPCAAITVRKSRAEWYAYPLPPAGTVYLAGTAHVVQRHPRFRPLDEWKHLVDNWAARMAPVKGLHSSTWQQGLQRQGWRPQPRDDAPPVEQVGEHRWQVRPGGARGLAGWPDVTDAVAALLCG